jgi:hypothetical protein
MILAAVVIGTGAGVSLCELVFGFDDLIHYTPTGAMKLGKRIAAAMDAFAWQVAAAIVSCVRRDADAVFAALNGQSAR